MKSKYVYLALGGLMAVVTFFYATISHWTKFKSAFEDSERVGLNESLQFKYHVTNAYKGYSYIKLENNRILVFDDLRNSKYDPKSLRHIIGVCDSISKDAHSDSISLYQKGNKKKYSFKLMPLK